jgi:hypothetical protein
VGALEGIDQDGIAWGWTMDLGTPSTSIVVHAYLDGPAGAGGTLIGVIPANIPRPDLPAPGSYGFRFPIPSQHRDGQPHDLYVYGVDGTGAASADLAGVPRIFALNSTVVHLDNGVIRVGLEPRCGGTVVELRISGENLVNNSDCTGRQIQAALYDGKANYDACAGCSGVWGWNPVQGGDRYNFGSPLLEMFGGVGSVHIATQPYEWFPDNKGGGPGQPVVSDVRIEQTASFMLASPYAVRLHYRIAHLGSDAHANAEQEFPAVYVNSGDRHLVSYAGTQPWTGGDVRWDELTIPGNPIPQHYVSERWVAVVDDWGFGLTVYVPQQFPYAIGLTFSGTPGEYGSSASYVRPHMPFTFGPGSVLDGDVYLIAGHYQAARQTVYALNGSGPTPDVLPPFGFLDSPADGQIVSGIVGVTGWVFDNAQTARVLVLVDGVAIATATYGFSRPDVSTVYPNAPEHVGFSYALDTRRYTNGLHDVAVNATDTAGNIAVLRAATIVVNNAIPHPR